MLTADLKQALGLKSPLEGLALAVNQKVGVIKCVWDFAVQGGAVSTIALNDENGNPCILPIKAIVTQVYSDVVTAPTTSASGTIALTANSAGDLKAALAAASYSGTQAGVPVGTAATMVKLTAQRQISLTIATGAVTAGKLNFFVQFVLSD